LSPVSCATFVPSGAFGLIHDAPEFIGGEVYLKLHGKLFAVLFLLVALTSVGYCSDERVEEKAAAYATLSWLALIDSNQYGESWFQAASEFRNSLSKEQRVYALRSVRARLGKLPSRQLKGATYTTKLPSAPAGEYVVVLYDTAFENRSGMIENVLVVKEKDGSGRCPDTSSSLRERVGSSTSLPRQMNLFPRFFWLSTMLWCPWRPEVMIKSG
jgi:Protein of unknown function (DUF4019)